MNHRNPQFIARWRTERNITQKDFADRIGISAGKLSGIELGQDPRLGYLISIAFEMKLSPVVLLYQMGLIQMEDILQLLDFLGVVREHEQNTSS